MAQNFQNWKKKLSINMWKVNTMKWSVYMKN
jgi:hypothetical protein